MNVSVMRRELDLDQSTMTYHLALLRNSGVIEPHRYGMNISYSLSEKGKWLAGIAKEITG
jgi:predicted transcriptional regulator